MPFAGFDDFDACTAEHSDKEDPEAYCAEIHKRTTGEYPGQKTATDLYSDPDLFTKYALSTMREAGVEPTDEKLDRVMFDAAEIRES